MRFLSPTIIIIGMKNKHDERRKEPRYKTDWPVFLRTDNETKQIGDVADISLSGIKLTLTEPVDDGKEAGTYDLYLYRKERPQELINITGRAVWSKTGENSIIMGLELENLDPEIKEQLKECIKSGEGLNVQMDLNM